MSVNLNISQENSEKGLDQSTFTISSISFQEEELNQQYDEEFTLNPLTAPPKNRSHCLAFQVAQTFPPRIRQQVSKMVEYYEDTLESQAKEFHRIVEENHKLKKENNKLRANHLASELRQAPPDDKKENVSPFRKSKAAAKPDEVPLSPARNRLNLRVSELENLVLDKDRKINELNS